MLFPSLTFILFFLAVFPVAWTLSPPRRRWQAFMLLASYAFYAAWDWRFVPLLVGSTLVNASLARRVDPTRSTSRRRAILALGVAANLSLLGWFKYYDFLADATNHLLATTGALFRLPLLEIVLPVGISFFTFQGISYLVDVYRGLVQPRPLLEVALYPAFFPHLVAGPIVRAAEFLPQLSMARGPRPGLPRQDLTRAAWLIVGGAAKKVVVASYLATAIVDPVFALPRQHSGLEILVGVYAYAVQIYADFSGYTDMAIGIALLLGIRFPQNFDRPYGASSLKDFWRRWRPSRRSLGQALISSSWCEGPTPCDAL